MLKSLLLLFFVSNTQAEPVYDFPITKVIDGDTIEFKADFLPDPLPKHLSLRVLGVDTPEKGGRAHCQLESDKGAAATEFTKNVVKNATRKEIAIRSWDKFGGRVLGELYLDGRALSGMLLENDLARAYHGEKKQSWCQ
jgi:endonuclease YncB( thermonuclease family)